MTSPETSNNAHVNDDLDQGPLAHHHTLGFGSQQAAPGNYSYRLVVQDEGTAVVTNPTVLNFAGTNVTATTVGTVCTVTVTGGGGSGSVWYSGAGVPSGGTGADGDFYLDTTNGNIYLKVSGTWVLEADLSGKVAKSSYTAKGDILVGTSTSGVPSIQTKSAFLPDGYTLQTVSANSTGVGWDLPKIAFQDEGTGTGVVRGIINFTGTAVAVTDDATNSRVNVAITGGSGGSAIAMAIVFGG